MSKIDYDIIIVGAGLSGLSMASYLANYGLNILIIEQKDLNIEISKNLFDGRAYAISYGSYKILQNAGIWQYVENDAGPILDILVSDYGSKTFLHYDHNLASSEPMGYMIAAEKLNLAAYNHVKETTNITIISNQTIDYIENNPDNIRVATKDNHNITGKLLIAADGKNSFIRKYCKIPTIKHNYEHDAIVCTIQHTKAHNNLAREIFLPTGPFACLPLKDQFSSSLVWTEKKALIPLYLKMEKAEINEQIKIRLGNYLGDISLSSELKSFPLTLVKAKKFYAHNIALIGDAAHGVHPLAGQGLNLGIRDIEILSKLILKNQQLGLPINSTSLLKEYNKVRMFDSWSLIFLTHGFNSIFGHKNIISKTTRRLGLSLVNRLPSLKARFIKHASGC